MNNDLISRSALKEEMQKADIKANDYETLAKMYENCVDNAPTVEPEQDKFECRMKIKDVISMLLEFDMNEKATIHTTDEYKENNIIISITDTRGEEE